MSVFIQNREHRIRLGQFATPVALCDLMLDAVIKNPGDRILDPATGDGRFLKRALFRGHPPENLHGMEADPDIHPDLPNEISITRGSFLEPLPFAPGLFDVIIGNPPYVRHEVLDTKTKSLIRALKDPILQNGGPDLTNLPETLDLYLWFFIRAHALLKPGGRLCFVTSNSWLFTQNGEKFTRWLAGHYQIRGLIDSGCERWFEDAAIHGLVSILEKKDASPESFPYIRLTQPLASVSSLTAPGENTGERRIIAPAMRSGGQKLSFWLKMPGFLEDQLQNHPDRWCRLDALGRVRYPVKSGINEFFYVDEGTVQQFGIEPEFLIPAMKSARTISRYTVNGGDCAQFLFSCTQTLDELARLGKHGALGYIRWGETQTAKPRQKRQHETPWPEVASVRGRSFWYGIPPLSPPDILCNRFVDKRYFFAACEGNLIEDQTFYGLVLSQKHQNHRDFIAALLNSTLVYTLLELTGQGNLGEGVLQCSRGDMAGLMIPNPDLYDAGARKKITAHWQKMKKRKIVSIEQELEQDDRRVLDRLILNPFFENPDDRDAFYGSLIKTCLQNALTRLQRSKNITRLV